MPEISELLREAAPSSVAAFDEAGVRRRVAQRRRHRRLLAGGGAAAVVVVLAGLLATFVPERDDRQSVVTDAPVVVEDVETVALVGDDVWTAGDGWVEGPGGARFEVPGPVRVLVSGGTVLVAAGEDWVAHIDTAAGEVTWTWDGETVGDAQPLPEGERVAVTAPDTGRVLVLADGRVAESIQTIGAPSDLVLTTGGELWVDDGDVICRVDYDAGTAPEEHAWSGTLLAPSASGGIWTTDGSRVVDLAPSNLASGQSVALGARYEWEATTAVETAAGLYAGGPAGLSRHDAEGGEVLDPDEPDALAGSDERVVYVVDGEVREAHRETSAVPTTATSVAGGRPPVPDDAPIGVWPETGRAEALAAISALAGAGETWRSSAEEVATKYATDVLGWSDLEVTPEEPSEDGRYGGVYTVADRSRRLSASVLLWPLLDSSYWVVAGVRTFPDEQTEGFASVSIDERGHVVVSRSGWIDGTEATLTTDYGGRTAEAVDAEAPVGFELDLGFVPDTAGALTVLWRDAGGVARGAWAVALPPGPFAAG